MSAFDGNPFADPFEKHTVQSKNTNQSNRGDYSSINPPKSATSSAIQGGSGPATMNPSFIIPLDEERQPSYTSSAQQQTVLDFHRREEELEKRAKDLKRREDELNQTPYNNRLNNWPPLPARCPWGLKPCFYQDINVDIPAEFRNIVQNLYYLWIAHAALLLSNLIVGILYLFGGGDNGETFGKALIYFILLIPLSYICWFRPAYKAFRSDSSMNFMIFFFVFSFQLLILIIHAMGIGNSGSCGFILGISTVNQGGVFMIMIGIIMITMGLGFALCALANFYLLVTIHKYYRGTGASMSKAQTEFTTGVMSNEKVQAAAAAVGKEIVTGKQTDNNKPQETHAGRGMEGSWNR